MPDGDPPTLSSQIRLLLGERGLLPPAAFERACRLEIESGERIDHIAGKLGLVSERDLATAYAELLGSPLLDPTDFPDEPVAAERIGRVFLKQARVIPLAESEAALVVAMAAGRQAGPRLYDHR
jgi:general secretion pathway protein E